MKISYIVRNSAETPAENFMETPGISQECFRGIFSRENENLIYLHPYGSRLKMGKLMIIFPSGIL